MASAFVEAQFKEVLLAVKEALTPFGYTKRRNRFRRIAYENLASIDIQRAQPINQGGIRFTVNAGIISARLLEASGFGQTIDDADCGSAHVHFRIGRFMEVPADIWWELDETSGSYSAIQEILPLLTGKAVPYLNCHLSDAALIKLWETGKSTGCTQKQREMYLKVLKFSASHV